MDDAPQFRQVVQRLNLPINGRLVIHLVQHPRWKITFAVAFPMRNGKTGAITMTSHKLDEREFKDEREAWMAIATMAQDRLCDLADVDEVERFKHEGS